MRYGDLGLYLPARETRIFTRTAQQSDKQAMSEFFAMGGHAAFIWPAYGITAVLLGGLLVLSLKSMRQREALVESLRGHRGRRRAEDSATTESGS
jgi:heme exporter protein D